MPTVPEAIILCGGAGTRLRSVTGTAPKSLAAIGDRPFLELLLHQLRRHGYQRVILAAGFQSDAILAYFGDRMHGMKIEYSIETEPLGTGGALRKAADQLTSASALILNGDSYTDADLSAFARDYHESRSDLSMVVVPVDGRVDSGSVSVAASGRVLGFKEKQAVAGTYFINAGIYLATKDILSGAVSGVHISLEKELFPQWLADGRYLRAFTYRGECIDIGTPERYQSAQVRLAHVEDGGVALNPRGQHTSSS